MKVKTILCFDKGLDKFVSGDCEETLFLITFTQNLVFIKEELSLTFSENVVDVDMGAMSQLKFSRFVVGIPIIIVRESVLYLWVL